MAHSSPVVQMLRHVGRFWIWIVIGTAVAVAGGLAIHREQSIGRGPAAWVVALGHPWSSVRNEAKRRLCEAGLAALPPVVECIREGPAERTAAAFRVLADLYDPGQPELADEIEARLADLEQDPSSLVRGLAAGCGVRLRDQRLARMITRCREMGAIIRGDPALGSESSNRRLPLTVILGETWSGGEEGLTVLARMPRLQLVQLLPQAAVTEENERWFRTMRPDVRLQRRGAGCLGVVGRPSQSLELESTCFHVFRVDAGSGADHAGLRRGDEIVFVDETRVRSFQTLIDALRDHEPGESVTIRAHREDRIQLFEVELGREDEDGLCLCSTQRRSATDSSSLLDQLLERPASSGD